MVGPNPIRAGIDQEALSTMWKLTLFAVAITDSSWCTEDSTNHLGDFPKEETTQPPHRPIQKSNLGFFPDA
jgi:hypothetical protein